MPLPPPVARAHIHTRRVACHGYRRDDGLWDIEGRIVDTKTYDMEIEWRGELPAGAAVHDMSIRLTVDDRLVVHDAVAVTDASPFAICAEAAPGIARVKGLRIGPGWTRAVKERLGGRHGCTHIMELLGPVATTAYQTVFPYRDRLRRQNGAAARKHPHPPIDSCYAYAEDSPVVARLRSERGEAAEAPSR